MKFIDMLKNVRKDDTNKHYLKAYSLCSVVDLSPSSYIDLDEQDRLQAFWLKTWMCTDTMVGVAAIFLDGELVGCTNQTARKNDYEIFFINRECAIKIRDYMLTLFDDTDPEFQYPTLTVEELETEYDAVGYHVCFPSDVCDDTGIDVQTGEKVRIIYSCIDYNKPVEQWGLCEVQYPDSSVRWKELRTEIIIPWRLEK